MAKKVYDEKINKSQDWGGDASTGNLPVAGGRVQEFLKEQLSSKAGVFHYDTTNNRYIVFADKETQDAYLADPTKTELIIGTFDAPFNYSAEITLSSPTYVALLAGSKNNYIDFTFDTKNKNGQSVGEDVICTYIFIKSGIKKTVTEKYRYGQAVHFKVDDYISTGTNTVTVGIVGQNTLAATTIGITYQVVDLQLTDTYDISQIYDIISNPAATAAIPYAVSGYGTKIMEWYLDGALLDYVKVEDEIVDVSTTRTKYISLANLSQGTHSLQYRAYTMVDGEKFYSNIMYRDLTILTGVNKNPIIGVAATIPVGNDIITSGNLQLFGITQYIPYDLSFAVYNPSGAASTDAVIAVDGKVEATMQTHNGEVNTYSLRPIEYGVKSLTITAGTTVYPIGLNIGKSTTSLEPITDGLQLALSALGKSNNDVDKDKWVYNSYSATFSGFNWNKTSGWSENRLLITPGAYVEVNLSPLSPDPTLMGKTLEFEFSTTNVSDDNAYVCDLRNSAGTGLLITASEVILKSSGGAEVKTKFKSEENIRIAFVINKKAGVANKGLALIYVNGVCSGAVNYAGTDNFTSDKTLVIGNTNLVDIRLKELRFYDNALSSDQLLNNYILSRDTTEELLGIYDKNEIYEEGTQNFSVDKLATQCPVFIFTGDIPALENTTDKNKTIYVDVEYINMQDPSRSFTGKQIRLRPQGTSSMGYPKKNFRPYTKYGEVWDNLGQIMVDGLYAFKEGSQPVNVWCLKADYAESSGTHNTGVARLWNQVMYNAQINGEYVLRTEAQKAAKAANYPYDVRTTVDGFPCNVFYRLTPESELIYIGKYNFNNDKSTESVFGFKDIPGFDNSRMQCWELLNNGNHLALFQDMDNFDAEWDKAYEARYPDKSEDVSDLKAFSEWVVSTKNDLAKFKAEKWNHLDVYKVAAYYVYLMRFGAVDQVIKNAMFTSEDGVHFYFINYDNDTVIGVRNDGLLIYNYDIDRQTIDESYTALVYAYAGHESTLWNNLEADEEFMRIVSEVDNALYMAGLSYEKTIDLFDNQQSGKWCERIYNQDAQYKYIGPYADSGINNLYMLQGARQAHRKWWLSRRFDLLDSKYVSGAYKAKSIEIKVANAPIGLKFSITAGNSLYYGYGLNNVPVETGIKLEPGNNHTFTTKQVINVGDPLRIYSAVNVESLVLQEFIEYISTLNISEVYNETVGTKLGALVLGVSTNVDTRRNTSLYAISGLTQAKRLEYLDISGYQAMTSLDLSQHYYFKTLKAYESGLTSVTFASGAPVYNLELPDTMQVLSLDNLPDLRINLLKIKNYGRNIHTLFIRNCGNLDAKSFVMNWNAHRLTAGTSCSVTLEGLSWAGVNVDDLLSLGAIKDEGGVLILKGVISLVSITLEQLNEVKRIFGDNVTTPGHELYIKAPDGVFVTGPIEILEGNSAQYSASVFSEHVGAVEYYIWNGSSEVSSYNGATIDKETGLMTTTITGSTRTITVRVKHIPTQGAIVRGEMQVKINKLIFPTSIGISGNRLLSEVGEFRYDLIVNTQNVNGQYRTAWSISGDAVTQGLVSLAHLDDPDFARIAILSIPAEITSFELKAEVHRLYDDQITATTTYAIELFIPGIIMTKTSNPEVLKICYEQGWCASPDYMTKIEASGVTTIDEFFKGKPITHFEELGYFTELTSLGGYCFQNCSSLTSIVIPEGVTSLSSYCFSYCSALTSIVIPSTVTTIGSSCFNGCTSLTSIVIPEGVTSLSSFCFQNCTSLTSIVIPEGVTRLGDSCFYGCASLTSIVIPSTVTSLGSGCFQNCSSLTSIVIPEGVTSLSSFCFYGCSKLTDIVIPSTVTSIGSSCFQNCSSLTSISVSTNNTNYASIDGVLFSKNITIIIVCPGGKSGEYIIPSTVTTIGSSCFSYCSALTDIVIPSTVTSIGSSCFQNCSSLTSIVIPEGVTSLSSFCFYGCSKLTDIVIPSTVTSLGGNCFYGCSKLTSIVIPEGVTTIDSNCFQSCRALTSIVIPSTVTTIDSYCFQGCTNLASIVIPEGVTRLDNNCFYGCTNLASIVIPSTVTTIGDSCFYGCASLTSIVIPEGVTSLDSNCFYGCTSLTSIVIPNTVTSLGNSCFSGCASLTSIVIPSTVTSIGDYCFYGCYRLASIVIPNTVTSIGSSCFFNCSALTNIDIPEGVTSLGSNCFSNCTSLTSITINRSTAPALQSNTFGISTASYTGRNTYDQGTNILYVPSGATGYDTGAWLDPLCNAEKCGFTISYTL